MSRKYPGEKPANAFASLPGNLMPTALVERTSGLANGSAGLFPSPALGKRRHRNLAGRRIAVRGYSIFVWRAVQRGAFLRVA